MTTTASHVHVDEWLTLRQVADRLAVALVTVSTWWRDNEFDRPPPGEPDNIWYRAPYGSATGYDRRLGGRLVNPAALDTFVPPSQRSRACVAAAGRLIADEAAAFVGCSVPHLNRAAQLGDLLFTVVEGVRAFDRADLETWRTTPTPTGRPRRSLDSERNKAVRPGPLLSFSDAWRLLGYADRASITRLVQRGRLPVVFDERGRKRVNRSDVEALVAEREARMAKREARA
ncbi:MerR family transcriptional regulator [Paraburkholderia dilworthii]|uniref:Helix-turn-helix domain-containing protein n=1 Tax=Paraburkholderia dilworthii TaxID=948106 RepID=A0ABW9D975_9BURK